MVLWGANFVEDRMPQHVCGRCGEAIKKGFIHTCPDQLGKDIRNERDPLLVEREKTHGSFTDVAGTAQDLKSTIRNRRLSSSTISEAQVEALDLICTKIARIVCGNPNERDHWLDIAGYAKLGAEACDGN